MKTPMKSIGDCLVELMTEKGLLEKETLEIKKQVANMSASELFQVDSIIKMGKFNENNSKNTGKKK